MIVSRPRLWIEQGIFYIVYERVRIYSLLSNFNYIVFSIATYRVIIAFLRHVVFTHFFSWWKKRIFLKKIVVALRIAYISYAPELDERRSIGPPSHFHQNFKFCFKWTNYSIDQSIGWWMDWWNEWTTDARKINVLTTTAPTGVFCCTHLLNYLTS